MVFLLISLKAEKKEASNTVIGMIFGCYALFELLSSLVFGKYVSIKVHMYILIFKNIIYNELFQFISLEFILIQK